MNPEIRVFPDAASLFLAATRAMREWISEAAHLRGICRMALAGGSTPQELYRLLAGEEGTSIPWHSLEVFWGDERWVPQDHPDSNAGMAWETLFLKAPAASARLHPIMMETSPETAAAAYESELRHVFGLDRREPPEFDLILLGMGADGHTASLFPKHPALKETQRLAVAVESPAHPLPRITLTLPVLNHAALVCFLVSGTAKAQALQRALKAEPDPACPASLVRPSNGRLLWMVDQAANSD
jgi:6-phosphogluconolactonase